MVLLGGNFLSTLQLLSSNDQAWGTRTKTDRQRDIVTSRLNQPRARSIENTVIAQKGNHTALVLTLSKSAVFARSRPPVQFR